MGRREQREDRQVKAVVHGTFVAIVVALLALAHLAAEDVRMQRETKERGLTLAVNVRPRILLSGGDVRIECRVPRIRTYRVVHWGLDCPTFYRASTETTGRIIYETLTRIPARTCGECQAFCEVDQFDRLGIVRALPQTLISKGLGCPEDPEGESR
jgi:hypothetical protein